MKYLMPAIICMLALFACEKESTDDDPGNPPPPPPDSLAVFTLTGSDSVCTFIPAGGQYIVGTALTSNENLTVEVDVSKVGYWKYSTDTLNGYYFSAAGKFDNPGKQNIVVNGHGSPALPGNSIFTLPQSVGALHRVISVLDGNVQLEPVPSGIYFKGVLGGVALETVYPYTDLDQVSYAYGHGDTMLLGSFVTPGNDPADQAHMSLSLQKQFLYHYKTSGEAEFKDFFQPAAYPYVDEKCLGYHYTSGMMIFLTTNSLTDTAWITLENFSDQEGSSFKIVGREDGHTPGGKYYVKTFCRFNCRMYSDPAGEIRDLVNGEAVSYWFKPPVQ